jgi:hypothetical protein
VATDGVLRGLGDAVGSTLTLTGAFAVGWALHRTLVVGDLAATSPPVVAAVAGGAALIGVGRALERRYGREVPAGDGTDDGADETATDPEETEFDERFAPVEEADLADRERDEHA